MDLDASRYDHIELWIRGDADEGFAPDLRIGFRRPRAGRRGLSETGSATVTGVTAEWQQILVPLNYMSGLRSWRDDPLLC